MPDSLQTDILNAKIYLQSQHMKIHDEWVNGCVEFFRQEQGNRSYSRQQLNDMVKSQWLLGDLMEISPGCLPPDLNSVIKSSLNGVYLLQLISLIDVGLPAYQQLQKLTKVDTTNIDVTSTGNNNNNTFQEPAAQRMLKLKLTDGVQEISAIEYRPMRNLSTDFIPGVKLQIKGPVDCRRGVVMLEEKHLAVLGGEVEDLMLVNQYKSVLTRIVATNSGLVTENTIPAATFTRDTYQPTRNNTELHLESRYQNNTRKNVHMNTNPQVPEPRQALRPTVNNSDTLENTEFTDLDAEMFLDDDFDVDQLDAIEQQALGSSNFNDCLTPKNAAKKMKISEAGQTLAQIPLHLNDYPEPGASTSNNEQVHRNFSSFPSQGEEFTRMEDMDDFADYYKEPEAIQYSSNKNIFNAIRNCTESSRIESKKPEIVKIERTLPVKVGNTPYIYLKQLTEIPEEKKLNKTFSVKAQIIKLNSKLALQNFLWVLSCKICDGSAFLDVEVSSEVLSQMVGYTPQQMSKMKSQMASNPSLHKKIIEGLNNAKEKFQKLDSVLFISYKSTGPCIVDTVDFQYTHLTQLKNRLSLV